MRQPKRNFDLRTETAAEVRAEKDAVGVIRTSHPKTRLINRGKPQKTAPAVYERVIYDQSPRRTNADEQSKKRRDLRADAFFGDYDWIVLWDETGALWQISAGTHTEDFAYRLLPAGPLEFVRDVRIRWLRTAPDRKARQHSPESWLVDVAAWDFRVQLERSGEHRGHGPADARGRRPIYAQIGVSGSGTVFGVRREFFGMVEHIRD